MLPERVHTAFLPSMTGLLGEQLTTEQLHEAIPKQWSYGQNAEEKVKILVSRSPAYAARLQIYPHPKTKQTDIRFFFFLQTLNRKYFEDFLYF